MADEYFSCPKKADGCDNSFHTFNELLNHVQNDCLYFGSKYFPLLPKVIKNPESYPTPNITKFLMTNEEPQEEEQPECFFFQPTQPQRNRILKKSDKQIKSGPQRFIKKEEVTDADDLEISKCLLKSNIFTVFKCSGKKIKYCVAFPNSKFEIVIKDLLDLQAPPVILKGHKDYITELKQHKINNQEFLYSCSYDNTCRSWKCNTWEAKDIIYNTNWVTSCTILNDKFKSGEYYALLTGGFNPNHPIKFFTITDSQLKGEIKFKDGSTSVYITHFHDEVNQRTYLFNAVENEKGSSIQMYDFHHKAIIRTFPSDKYVTKIEFHIDNSNFLIITYVDFKGSLRQFNAESGKMIKTVNLGTNCFDLLSWDDEYFIACGDQNEQSFKIIYKDGLQIVKSYPHFHNNVILNLGMIELPNEGKTLITLGADKKIIIYKK